MDLNWPAAMRDARTRSPVRLLSPRFRRGRDSSVRLSDSQRKYVDDVKRRLLDGVYRLVPTECPCGLTDGFVVSRVDRYGLPLDTVMCAGCGTLRFDPYLTPHDLSDFYVSCYQEMYARVSDPAVYFARQQHYGQRLLAWAGTRWPKDSLVVEVGCGAGGCLRVFQDAGYRVMGCDYSEPLLELGRKQGVRSLDFGGFEALAEKLVGSDRPAVVFLHHVFEHIPTPLDLLTQAKARLADGGLVIVAVPDVTRIDRFRYPAGNLRPFLHIAHSCNYTMRGLEALGRRAGLEALALPVAESTEAPELWVGFGLGPAASAQRSEAGHRNAEALFRHLRVIERRFIGRALAERLGRVFGYHAPQAPERHPGGDV
jgi:SAM-dependent methyltransferase